MSWQSDLLTLLGIPVTDSNVTWISNWFNAEEPNGGFGPGYYSYYTNNPINIKVNGQFANFSTPQEGLSATANWLKTNGNFGNLGTYAQEIKAFLTGQPNNIASSLAYYSGHSGNPSLLTTSYQNLVSGSGNSSGANTNVPAASGDSTQGGTSIQSRLLGNTKLTNQTDYATCQWYDVTCNTNNMLLYFQNQMNNIQENIMDNLIVAAMAIALLVVGVNWLGKTNVMQLELPEPITGGNDNESNTIKKVAKKIPETAEAAI